MICLVNALHRISPLGMIKITFVVSYQNFIPVCIVLCLCSYFIKILFYTYEFSFYFLSYLIC